MQFSKLFIVASALIAGSSAGNVVLEYSTVNNTLLNYLGSFSASYANRSLYIGQVKYQTYSEPYTVDLANSTYFTSYHSSPTGGQELYIFPNETAAVGFTVPHGGYLGPAGSTTADLKFDGPNSTLAYKGVNKFYGCQPTAALKSLKTYQIYWAGDGVKADNSCLPVDLIQTTYC